MRKIFILRHIKNKSLQRGSFRMSMSAVSLWCSFLWGYCSKKYINITSKILAGTYAKLCFEMDAVTRADPEFFL